MRRKKGEGTIIEYEPGKWLARIKINGKQIPFYGKSEKEVAKRLKDFKSKIAKGLTDYRRMSYEDFLDEWLAVKKQALKEQSYDRIESTVNQHIRTEIGYYFVDKLDDVVIRDLLKQKAKTLSYSSIKKIYDAINASLKYAKSKGMLVNNPVELVEKPVDNSGGGFDEIEIFTDEDIKRFVETAKSTYSNGKPRYKNSGVFLLTLNTGMRISEACALKWTDYNEKDSTITVDASIVVAKDKDGKRRAKEQKGTKTEKGSRVLKLNANAVDALPTERIGKYIFCTKDKKHLRHRNAQRMLDAILERAGMEHKSTHVFRHTFASRLFEKGYDVRIVSEILGHSNTNTTYNRYIHLIKAQKAKAMDSIDLY